MVAAEFYAHPSGPAHVQSLPLLVRSVGTLLGAFLETWRLVLLALGDGGILPTNTRLDDGESS